MPARASFESYKARCEQRHAYREANAIDGRLIAEAQGQD
jgi:hypothetical protein